MTRNVMLMALASLAATLGCGTDAPPQTSTSHPALCGMDTAAWVTQTDPAYAAPGHVARIAFGTLTTTVDRVFDAGEDPVLKSVGGSVYLINRMGGPTDADNVTAYGLDGHPLSAQISTGAGTNPQDVVEGGDGKAYVAELAGPGVAVLDLHAGMKVGEIDLSSLDPEDGKPNIGALYVRGGLLFAVAQRLDENFHPRGPGRIGVWDLAGNRMAGPPIEMVGTNPFTWVKEEPGTTNVLIGMVDFTGVEGGIERIDLDARVSRGLAITADALGHRYVSDFVVNPFGQLYVTAVDPATQSSDLLRFDLKASLLAVPVLQSGHFSALALDPCEELWIVDRGSGTDAPYGIRIWDTGILGGRAGNIEVTAQPIHPALPPGFAGSIVFVP